MRKQRNQGGGKKKKRGRRVMKNTVVNPTSPDKQTNKSKQSLFRTRMLVVL